jgi:hypothetical protein
MSDDQSEIISRPPSHPIATTLIIISMLATMLCIGLTWDELFSEYLPTPGPGVKIDKSHSSVKIASDGRKDHFAADRDFKVSIAEELGGKDRPLSSSIGGGDGLGGG